MTGYFVGDAPLVINPSPRTCPSCGGREHIASVLRDGGSELYCAACHDRRWPNPDHVRGAEKLARLKSRSSRA